MQPGHILTGNVYFSQMIIQVHLHSERAHIFHYSAASEGGGDTRATGGLPEYSAAFLLLSEKLV